MTPAGALDLFTGFSLHLSFLLDTLSSSESSQDLLSSYDPPIPFNPISQRKRALLWCLLKTTDVVFKTSVFYSEILCQALVGTRSQSYQSSGSSYRNQISDDSLKEASAEYLILGLRRFRLAFLCPWHDST